MLIHEFESQLSEFPDCIPIKFMLGETEIVPTRLIRTMTTSMVRGDLYAVEELVTVEFTYGTSKVQEQARP